MKINTVVFIPKTLGALIELAIFLHHNCKSSLYLISPIEDNELDVLSLGVEGVPNQVDVGQAATELEDQDLNYLLKLKLRSTNLN